MNFDDHVNIIYGDNAQGKTNILEALYVCATSRSHRSSKDKDIIEFDRDEAHIKVAVVKNDSNYRIDMHLKKNKHKGIAVNGIPIQKAVELFGIINITDGSMEIKVTSAIGSSNEDIDINKEGKDIMIGFNPKFLMDALRVIDDETVDIYLVNPKAPCFIRDSQENYIYLILPVNFSA